MGLHRDIYWVGRQWAVTGFGVQAVDQRLKGAFDVEAGRLWDDDLPRRMRALAWLNPEDFDKALELARARFPEPPRRHLPLVESVLELMQPAAEPAKAAASIVEARPAAESNPLPRTLVAAAPLNFRLDRASAKFLPRWRVRHGRQAQNGGVTGPG